MLALVAGGLPVSDSLARWSRRPSVSRGKGKHLRHRRTRAWWKRRRALLRRRRARALHRRQLIETAAAPRRARSATTKVKDYTDGNTSMNGNVSVSMPVNEPAPTAARRISRKNSRLSAASRVLMDSSIQARTSSMARAPFDLTLPGSWSSSANSVGEMKFVVRSVDGQSAGTASLAPVAINGSDVAVAPRTKMLGGVPLSVLRRTVIDKMVAEGGWVVNDMEREIEGRRVFVVLARTGAAASTGEQQALTFYFTEIDGRIYRLATNTPVALAEPVASASEKIVSTFRVSGNGGTVAAKTPR
jgi:hypothetical protein